MDAASPLPQRKSSVWLALGGGYQPPSEELGKVMPVTVLLVKAQATWQPHRCS